MSQIVMRCAAPIMTAAGVQRYKPGDLLPVGDPDASGWEWAEFIAADDVVFAKPVGDAPVAEPAAEAAPKAVEPAAVPAVEPEVAVPAVEF